MLTLTAPRVDIDPGILARSFDRVPFGFTHELHRLDLFSPDSLRALAAASTDRDHFVAAGAPSPSTDFYAVQHGRSKPLAAIDSLDREKQRILIKRPETFDARFKRLLDELFPLLVDLRGERLIRLESSVLISSAETITPFHFDPETSFFFQIEGEKLYHLFAPDCIGEPELERFYKKGIVNIGQIDYGSGSRSDEHLFSLEAGKGLHQPHRAPHWVETRATRAVSYVVAFETAAMRSRGLTRAFNYYMRRSGFAPALPGTHPRADALKAGVMRTALPLRKSARGLVRAALGRSARP